MVLNHIISPHTHAHTGGRIKTNTCRFRKDENKNLAILVAHLVRVFKHQFSIFLKNIWVKKCVEIRVILFKN